MAEIKVFWESGPLMLIDWYIMICLSDGAGIACVVKNNERH